MNVLETRKQVPPNTCSRSGKGRDTSRHDFAGVDPSFIPGALDTQERLSQSRCLRLAAGPAGPALY